MGQSFATESVIDQGLRAYREGYPLLARDYLSQACGQMAPAPARRAQACYLAATLALDAHHVHAAEPLLWRALVLAPPNSPIQREALLASLALYQPQQWYVATGQAEPLYRPVASSATAANGTDRFELTATGEDYLADVLHNGAPLHWALSRLPLKVYIEPKPQQLPYFTQGYITAVQQALATWAKALGNRLTTQPVASAAQADIAVTWIAGLGDNQRQGDGIMAHAGLTTPTLVDGQLNHMAVTIAVTDPVGKAYSPVQMQAIALHEIGHALGVLGHSSNPNDVMSRMANGKTSLSARDIATVRRLYSGSSGTKADSVSKNSATKTPSADAAGKDDAQLAGLQRQIDQNRAATLNNPTWLEWSNYGKSLYNKALVLQQRGDNGLEAQRLLAQAQTAFEKGIALSPNQLDAQLSRVKVLEAMGKPQVAATQLAALQQKHPNAPDIYREQVTVLLQLNQTGAARRALADYLRLRPQAADSAWVKSVKANGL